MATTEFSIKLNNGVSQAATAIQRDYERIAKAIQQVNAQGNVKLPAIVAPKNTVNLTKPGGLLGGVDKMFSQADKIANQIWNNGGDGPKKNPFEGWSNHIKTLKEGLESFKETDIGAIVSTGASMAVGALTQLITVAAAAATAFAAIGAAATAAFAKTAISTVVFRQNSLVGLEVLLKDKGKALSIYNQAVEMAAKTPFETTDVIPLFQKLLTAGFKENELVDVATAIGDIAASKGMDKGLMDRLSENFGKLKNKGKLNTEIMNMFTEAGVNGEAIYEEIGKLMGKKSSEVQKLIEAGKVNSDIGTKAILNVIKNTFGGTMDKMSKTLLGLWSTFVSRPFDLFNKAFENDKGGLSKWIYTIQKAVEEVGNALDPKSKTGQKVIAFIDLIGSSFDGVSKLIIGFAKGFAKGFSNEMPDASQFAKIDITKLTKDMEKFGESLGKVVGYLGEMTAYLTQIESKSNSVSKTASPIWTGIKVIAAVLGTLVVLAAAIPIIMSAIFYAVVAAVVWGIGKLAEYVEGFSLSNIFGQFTALPGVISGCFGAVYSAAASLGNAIMTGIRSCLGLDSIRNDLASLVPGTGGFNGGGIGGMKDVQIPAAEIAPKTAPNISPNGEMGFNASANANASVSTDNSKTIVNNFTVNFPNATSMSEIKAAFEQLLKEKSLALGNA